jgi:ADP-ribose pyrophosphatase YjhB (NUDIX family)
MCEKCGWIYYRNPLPVVVCAVRDKLGRILVVKRNMKPGLNKWALPGGFVESNESLENACLRELREETGLRCKIKRLIGVYTQATKEYGSVLVAGFEAYITGGSLSINSELKEACFVYRKGLPSIPFSSHNKILSNL